MRKTALFALFMLLSFAAAGVVCFAGVNDDLFDAIKAKDIQKVEALLSSGTDVNALAQNIVGVGNISPLSYAASEGDTEIVRLLLEKGANVKFRHPMGGGTPLTDAAQGGYTEIVKMLLDKGADINATQEDMMGLTALTGAAFLGHTDVVKLLLDRGVPVDGQTDDGSTPLQLAVSSAHPELVQLLLEKGADVNHKDKNGRTALMDAAASDCPLENLKLLIAKGANVNAKDNQGRAAIFYAQAHANNDVIQLLVHAGANGGKMPDMPPSGLTAADIKFLANDCKIGQSDIDAIPKLDKKTQQIIVARTAMRDCKLLQPFTASRNYLRQLKPNEHLPMPPPGFDSSYFTDEEFNQYQKIVENAPW